MQLRWDEDNKSLICWSAVVAQPLAIPFAVAGWDLPKKPALSPCHLGMSQQGAPDTCFVIHGS